VIELARVALPLPEKACEKEFDPAEFRELYSNYLPRIHGFVAPIIGSQDPSSL
jgi:hypothetical protein